MKGNLFVSKSGSYYSYTNNIINARKFKTIQEAKKEKCGNEFIKCL